MCSYHHTPVHISPRKRGKKEDGSNEPRDNLVSDYTDPVTLVCEKFDTKKSLAEYLRVRSIPTVKLEFQKARGHISSDIERVRFLAHIPK